MTDEALNGALTHERACPMGGCTTVLVAGAGAIAHVMQDHLNEAHDGITFEQIQRDVERALRERG